MKKIKPLPADELPQPVEPESALPVAQIEPTPRMQHLQQSLVSTAHCSAMDALVQSAAHYAATRTTGAQVAPPSGGEADMEVGSGRTFKNLCRIHLDGRGRGH